jgi:mRNA-degrading endonuclease RelE of RelBE toxin-antitoxin system
MKAFISERAKKELDEMNSELAEAFLVHIEKLLGMPPRRHLKHGIPCHVENVTKQARMIYEIDGENLQVLHCFSSHKEYERWYKSYK